MYKTLASNRHIKQITPLIGHIAIRKRAKDEREYTGSTVGNVLERWIDYVQSSPGAVFYLKSIWLVRQRPEEAGKLFFNLCKPPISNGSLESRGDPF